jgi:hypothetical protein
VKSRMKGWRFLLFLLVLLGFGVWFYTYQTTFLAIPYNDAMDYASIGRNIARGQGITSAYMTPLGLRIHPYPQPNMWRAPLWPLILGGVQYLFPSTDGVIAWATGFFYLAGLVVFFLLAKELFGIGVAWGSALVYIFSPLNLHFSTSGMTETIALFLLLFWFYLLALPKMRSPRGDYFIGAVGGLFYLARYNALLFAPLVAVYWWLKRREEGWHPVLRYGGSFLAIVAPWFVRNFILFGNPLFSLQKFEIPMFTSVHPNYTLYMIPELPNVLGFIRTYPKVLLRKILGGLQMFGADFFNPDFTGVAVLLLVLALLSLLIPLAKRAKELFLLGVVCFLTQLAALVVIHYIPRLFFIFLPFYIMYGLAVVNWVAEKVWGERKLAAGILILAVAGFCIWSNLPDWAEPNVYIKLADQFAEPLADLTQLLGKDEVVVSNDGHLVAWYSDRPAVKIPYHPDMLREMEEYAPITAIFISHRITWNTPEMNVAWWEIFRDQQEKVLDYKLYRTYENGTAIYLKDAHPAASDRP